VLRETATYEEGVNMEEGDAYQGLYQAQGGGSLGLYESRRPWKSELRRRKGAVPYDSLAPICQGAGP